MGKEIEQVALDRGHDIILTIDINDTIDQDKLAQADVAIEFTSPESAVSNYQKCFSAGVPVVSGTTGWLEKKGLVENECIKNNGCFFYASNFSLGVNLFFELNKQLAGMMKNFDQYDVGMTEVHHTQKLDAPSGTAISLAEDILDEIPGKNRWAIEDNNSNESLYIKPVREGKVPGIHTVKYESDIDFIEITHSAKSRRGFAFGAVLAAEFCKGKKGILSMKEMLKI